MLRYIENLRKKPEQTRKAIALAFAAIVLFAIFSYWLYVLPGKIGGETAEENPEESSSSPFELVKSAGDSVYGDFNDVVDGAKNAWPF